MSDKSIKMKAYEVTTTVVVVGKQEEFDCYIADIIAKKGITQIKDNGYCVMALDEIPNEWMDGHPYLLNDEHLKYCELTCRQILNNNRLTSDYNQPVKDQIEQKLTELADLLRSLPDES